MKNTLAGSFALTACEVEAEASRIRLVQIGEMAGPNISLPAAALPSSGLEIYGSGGGSIPHQAIFDAFPQMWALAASGKLHIDTEQVPLSAVDSAWQRQALHGRRLVIIPVVQGWFGLPNPSTGAISQWEQLLAHRDRVLRNIDVGSYYAGVRDFFLTLLIRV